MHIGNEASKYIEKATRWLVRKVAGPYLAGPYRRLFPRQRPDNWDVYRNSTEKRVGLEIGGPSRLWATGHFLPIYSVCEHVDGLNFSDKTFWEGRIQTGRYRCEGAHGKGRQFIADAVDLSNFSDSIYGFILACHVLEHIANPIKALQSWQRVLKKNGHLVLAVPHRDGHLPLSRPGTQLDHLIEDFESHTSECDLTHVDELVEARTDLLNQKSRDEYRALSMQNINHRMMHHHSFEPKLVVSLINHVGLQIRAVNLLPPYHIVCLAEKLTGGHHPDNEIFLADDAAHLKNLPFSLNRSSLRRSVS